jgi:hypothetical protein
MTKSGIVAAAAAVTAAAVGAAVWFLRRAVNELDQLPVYVLKNESGLEVHVSAVGGAIMKLLVPDKDGVPVDVVLGYDRASRYMVRSPANAR